MAAIMLKNVRLSFASLFEHEEYNQESTGKYAATFLLDKNQHADTIKLIEKTIADFAVEKFGAGKVPKLYKQPLMDGDMQDYDGYAGCMSIKGSTKKRPIIIDQQKVTLTKEDERIFSGDYVNAKIDFWFQDNSYGKRINCNLIAVQLFKQGERFGGGDASVDDFDSYSVDDDDF